MTQATDRKLLVLAAKAAAVDFDPTVKSKHGLLAADRNGCQSKTYFWNPAKDDGACARLEAALAISVEWHEDLVISITKHHAFGQAPSAHGGDKQAARRLATLQVAAAIGEFGS